MLKNLIEGAHITFIAKSSIKELFKDKKKYSSKESITKLEKEVTFILNKAKLLK